MKVWIVQPVNMTKEGDIVSYISINNCRLEVFDSFEKAKEFVSSRMRMALMEPEFCFTAADIVASYGEKPLVVYVQDEENPSTYYYIISEKEVQ